MGFDYWFESSQEKSIKVHHPCAPGYLIAYCRPYDLIIIPKNKISGRYSLYYCFFNRQQPAITG